MRVAVVGDLHIGPLAGRDAVGQDTDGLVAWLGEVRASHDHLVLNGDIFQCDHGLGVGAAAEARALHACLARVPALVELMADPGVHYLHGNHDRVARDELGAPTELHLEGTGHRLLVTHGDAFDPVLDGVPALSHAATWVCGRVRAAGLSAVAGWLEGRDVAIKAARHQGPGGPYARAASSLAADREVDRVVFGHTHVPCLLDLDTGGLLANPGACAGGGRRVVRLDLSSGSVELS